MSASSSKLMKKLTKKAKPNKIKNITNTVKISKTVNKNSFMEPKHSTCFYCQKLFKINYNRGIGMPSQKNY
jgi:hypothetical protein